jgi:hypothetical protein
MTMLSFMMAALAEFLIGLFIYAVYDPEPPKQMYMYKAVINLDNLFFDKTRDKAAIREVNKIVLLACAFFAILTLTNGIILNKINIGDYKELFIIASLVVAFPIRYICIFVKR